MTINHKMIIGYKKLELGLICVLEINPEDSNLKRDNVVDKNYAKFRCSKAKVVNIYHMNTKKEYSVGSSLYNVYFKYIIGKTVSVDNYDTDINKVCSTGIHFFLNEEAAYSWDNIISNKSWHENGQLHYERTYKDCKLNGKYKKWYENGQLELKSNYKDDKLIGEYNTWYENGQLCEESNYKDDKKDGGHKKWYENGILKLECTYKDDNIDGELKKWYENGKLYKKCIYYYYG